MNEPLKNYNIFALRGEAVNDMEVCEALGLDPKLAFTPELNEAAIRKMHRENYNAYINRGMDSEDAIQQADELANQARRAVADAMK
jgi:hypothetical protein